ncbi:SDR family oxidoreductase [Nocardioides sp.]|uniref:SDR family NAD(P)-dependent oxidoreductase n=1 Tax=Nocardioides sp. TaxID=35761 RepID=UPI0031FF3C3A|nr:3-oxoacyl-[acyl-carrier-protein] reductase [Nocardioides sp.]
MTARVALITGGARGLGLSIAQVLAERGYTLLLVDRDEAVYATATGLGGDSGGVTGCVADLTVSDDVERLVEFVRGSFDGLDVLVNNAGITRDARLGKMEPEVFSSVIDVNLLAPLRLTFALDSSFRDGSSIVNMTSRAALGNFGQTNYVASKSGLIGFTRGLALQWSPRTRVNAVAPGLVDSAMSRAMPEDVLGGLVAKIPAGRIGEPEDVARAVAFLAGDESSYITGQVLTVCGGRSISA